MRVDEAWLLWRIEDAADRVGDAAAALWSGADGWHSPAQSAFTVRLEELQGRARRLQLELADWARDVRFRPE